MNIEIARATHGSAAFLAELDRQMFSELDAFAEEQWADPALEAFLLTVDGEMAGSVAIQQNTDLGPDGSEFDSAGSLYIVSIGILPKFQKNGLGLILEAWEIAYAKINGCTRVVSNMRASNTASVLLHERLGFSVRNVARKYYPDGEDAFVMELLL